MKITDRFIKNQKFIFFLILLLGTILRVYHFGVIPSGLNQDEAFAGYEAFSLLHYGIDSAGYHNPTYFVSWGSGMNVLESYLAIPFVWLLGNTAVAIRMPMLICSILSILVFYFLLKELYDEKTALFGFFVLAVCPWHVMLSRWGVESNLAPAFLLFGLFFLVKGLKKNQYWPLAALMYGLSLYAYAITWIVVPLTLVAVFSFMLFSRYGFSLKYFVISVLILFLLALPHILFLLINMNVIPEIRTSLFSIPKLVAMRGSEVSLKNNFSIDSFVRIIRIVFGHGDDLLWNTFDGHNLYYTVSVPFLFVGFVEIIKLACKQVKARTMNGESVIWIGILCSCFVTLLITEINVNKANHLHMYMIVLIALGMRSVMNLCGKRKNVIMVVITLIYTISVWNFSTSYFKTYNTDISVHFRDGLKESIDFVNEKGYERVNVDSSVYYPQVLYYDKTATPDYIESRNYTNYPDAFLQVGCFTKYTFGIDYESVGDYDAYIVPVWKTSRFQEEKYSCETFGICSVFYLE